ncbi:hypothetical protein NDU88_001427 [Pleurodeles waltl]|uniref:Uncharacterized protein n=1 Tax=Pleurodeles waltl TaxID=8319 RepID=A0AAV7P5H2_PLEWA|nr:hypothetical protein NDU88_001427 [Pleurodeles waltl]
MKSRTSRHRDGTTKAEGHARGGQKEVDDKEQTENADKREKEDPGKEETKASVEQAVKVSNEQEENATGEEEGDNTRDPEGNATGKVDRRAGEWKNEADEEGAGGAPVKISPMEEQRGSKKQNPASPRRDVAIPESQECIDFERLNEKILVAGMQICLKVKGDLCTEGDLTLKLGNVVPPKLIRKPIIQFAHVGHLVETDAKHK